MAAGPGAALAVSAPAAVRAAPPAVFGGHATAALAASGAAGGRSVILDALPGRAPGEAAPVVTWARGTEEIHAEPQRRRDTQRRERGKGKAVIAPVPVRFFLSFPSLLSSFLCVSATLRGCLSHHHGEEATGDELCDPWDGHRSAGRDPDAGGSPGPGAGALLPHAGAEYLGPADVHADGDRHAPLHSASSSDRRRTGQHTRLGLCLPADRPDRRRGADDRPADADLCQGCRPAGAAGGAAGPGAGAAATRRGDAPGDSVLHGL